MWSGDAAAGQPNPEVILGDDTAGRNREASDDASAVGEDTGARERKRTQSSNSRSDVQEQNLESMWTERRLFIKAALQLLEERDGRFSTLSRSKVLKYGVLKKQQRSVCDSLSMYPHPNLDALTCQLEYTRTHTHTITTRDTFPCISLPLLLPHHNQICHGNDLEKQAS